MAIPHIVDGENAGSAFGKINDAFDWIARLDDVVSAIEALPIPRDGVNGTNGINGKSAYEIAQANGFSGTESAWLESLRGPRGSDASIGNIPQDLATLKGRVDNHQTTIAQHTTKIAALEAGGTGGQGAQGPAGAAGKSAYQIAVDRGYIGTEAQWLVSLKGANGTNGAAGAKGDKGDKGDTGAKGEKGEKGDTGAQGPQGIQGPRGQDGAAGTGGGTGGISLTSYPERSTSLLTKNHLGRVTAGTMTADTTVMLTMELESQLMALRIGIPNISTAAQSGIKVCVGFRSTASTSGWSAETEPHTPWYDLTFGGQPTATLAPRLGAERPSYTWSDYLPEQSLSRTEDPAKPNRAVVLIRLEYPAGTVMSKPANGVAGWRGATSQRRLSALTQKVAGVSIKSAFTQYQTVETGDIVIPAVQYMSTSAGQQMLIVGDSIAEGLGSTPLGAGAAQRIAMDNSTPESPIEYFNAALHAQSPDVYHHRVGELLPVVKPTKVIYQPLSPNQVPSSGLTEVQLRASRLYLTLVLETVRSHAAPLDVVLLPALPIASSFKNIGNTDSLRTNFNVWLGNLRGPLVPEEYVTVINGTVTNGQMQPKASLLSSDSIHPNSAGYVAMAAAAKDAILKKQ